MQIRIIHHFFATYSLLGSIASTLLCFDITKDSQGRDVEPDIQWDPVFTRYILEDLLILLWGANILMDDRHIIPFKGSITPPPVLLKPLN